MDNTQFLGYLITAIISLGGFIGIIMKFVQPINDLRVVIQKLNDNLDSLKTDSGKHDKTLEVHEEKIDNLDRRVGGLETKMDIYHKDR